MSKHRLRQWTLELWRWLAEARLVLMGIVVVLAATLLGFAAWHSEESIRVAGYVLQLNGMIFAIRGLLGVRAYFRQPLLRQLLIKWIKRFPKWQRSIVIGSAAGHITMSGMKARAEVWTPDAPTKTVEQRIEGIISNLDRIRNEQREHANSIEELKNGHEEHKKYVAQENKKINEHIRSDIESLHTSDLIASLVGMVWLMVGITMSTLAHEISKWLY